MTGTHDAKRLFVRLKPSGGNVVIGMEATGYLLVFVVVAFFLYSWHTQVPVLAGTQGTASPATVDILAKEDTAVLECFVKHGQQVKKGQPLLRVTDNPVEVSLLRARKSLQSMLATNTQNAVAEKWAGLLDAPDLDKVEGTVLTAPMDSWVICVGGVSIDEAMSVENAEKKLFGKPPACFVDKGTVMLFLSDFSALRVTAKLPKEQWAKKIEMGLPTKVWFADKLSNLSKGSMPATLIKIVNAEDAGKLGADIPGGKIVTAEGSISHLPASAREKARVDFFDMKMEKWRPAIAITVFQQCLLNQLRTPKPTD